MQDIKLHMQNIDLFFVLTLFNSNSRIYIGNRQLFLAVLTLLKGLSGCTAV